MGSVGKMGRVGKREHHLTVRLCKAFGSDNADYRTTYYPFYPQIARHSPLTKKSRPTTKEFREVKEFKELYG